MKDRRIATLADVARRAQVSTATVSRCLNETGRVSRDASLRATDAPGTGGARCRIPEPAPGARPGIAAPAGTHGTCCAPRSVTRR